MNRHLFLILMNLTSISELLVWNPRNRHEDPPQPWELRITQTGRLVCHDFKGGYLEEERLEGTFHCRRLKQLPYVFLHWHAVDTFIYFSHHCVTIPPKSWIDIAHTNGVRILGTFITESREACDLLFERDHAEVAASKLAAIAEAHGFDGWLINIENDVANISQLVRFTSLVTKYMHDHSPWAKVIWYDAVTIDGKLRWQNALNDKNRTFYHCTDGIFLNYWWHHVNAEKDVYYGVDVWQRGCQGKASLMSRNIDMMTTLDRHGASSAIFAPGWTLESIEGGLDGKPFIQRIHHWLSHDIALWRGMCGPLPQMRKVTLPFYTNFCIGMGNAFYIDGTCVYRHPWCCLTLQRPILCFPFTDAHLLIQWDFTHVYSGGCSLRLEGKGEDEVCMGVPLATLEATNKKICRVSLVYMTPSIGLELSLNHSRVVPLPPTSSWQMIEVDLEVHVASLSIRAHERNWQIHMGACHLK